MPWPGEALIQKMWESLVDKGIGGLLRPHAIRADGRAHAVVKAEEMLLLAQAERQAEAIRRGDMDVISEPGKPLLLVDHRKQPAAELNSSSQEQTAQAAIEQKSPLQLSFNNLAADQIRREVNLAKAILNAETELIDDISKPSNSKVETDWLYKWRDYASETNSDELQQLWGRLLANEVKAPGKFSLRTLEFVRNLSAKDAKEIERLSPFAFDTLIYRDDQALETFDIQFWFILQMQEFGLLSGAEALGLSTKIFNREKDKYFSFLKSHNKILLIRHSDPQKTLTINSFALTKIGREVLSLCQANANEEYLRICGKQIADQGFQVEIADCTVLETRIQWSNIEKIS